MVIRISVILPDWVWSRLWGCNLQDILYTIQWCMWDALHLPFLLMRTTSSEMSMIWGEQHNGHFRYSSVAHTSQFPKLSSHKTAGTWGNVLDHLIPCFQRSISHQNWIKMVNEMDSQLPSMISLILTRIVMYCLMTNSHLNVHTLHFWKEFNPFKILSFCFLCKTNVDCA